jgi:hypothetical protein
LLALASVPILELKTAIVIGTDADAFLFVDIGIGWRGLNRVGEQEPFSQPAAALPKGGSCCWAIWVHELIRVRAFRALGQGSGSGSARMQNRKVAFVYGKGSGSAN